MERRAFKLLFDAEASWWYRARAAVVERILEKFHPNAPGAILDFGAGWGGMHDTLANHGAVDAFEPDAEARAVAMQRGYRTVLPFGDLDNVPDERYTLVALLDVLEHTENDAELLARLHDKLIAGGELVITVPAFRFLWSGHDVEHHHFRRYRKRELVKLLEQNGFSVRYASYWNMLLFLPAALVRLSGRSGSSALELRGFLNNVFLFIPRTESRLMPLVSLPFGTGIVLYAKKR